MTESQQEAIAMLNDMYCSQSKDFQFRYKKNYFALVEFILRKGEEPDDYESYDLQKQFHHFESDDNGAGE